MFEDTLPPLVRSDDACVLGLTLDDLYPEPGWIFAFGEASLEERVGVFSLFRFFSRPAAPRAAELLLRRSMRTLAHETGHMFSIPHCIKFECVMNGSNSLEESDTRHDLTDLQQWSEQRLKELSG